MFYSHEAYKTTTPLEELSAVKTTCTLADWERDTTSALGIWQPTFDLPPLAGTLPAADHFPPFRLQLENLRLYGFSCAETVNLHTIPDGSLVICYLSSQYGFYTMRKEAHGVTVWRDITGNTTGLFINSAYTDQAIRTLVPSKENYFAYPGVLIKKPDKKTSPMIRLPYFSSTPLEGIAYTKRPKGFWEDVIYNLYVTKTRYLH